MGMEGVPSAYVVSRNILAAHNTGTERIAGCRVSEVDQASVSEKSPRLSLLIINGSPGELSIVYDGTISLEEVHKLSIESPDNCTTLRTAL